MAVTLPKAPAVDRESLRDAIRDEYKTVAQDPDQGFHFHTGRRLAGILGYDESLLDGVPERAIESFAGTGNPFRMGSLGPGERVIAGRMVGPDGRVVGVDMTEPMLEKATEARTESGLDNVEFRKGYGEELPVPDGWADVVISNGVFNLMPDKLGALREMARVLKPGGRLQLADILVTKPVNEKAKEKIDLWTG